MAEPAKSKRDTFLSGRYPGRQFADDEEMFGQIGQDFDALENEKNTLAQREKDFSNFISADPRNAGLFMRIKRGEDLFGSSVNMAPTSQSVLMTLNFRNSWRKHARTISSK